MNRLKDGIADLISLDCLADRGLILLIPSMECHFHVILSDSLFSFSAKAA